RSLGTTLSKLHTGPEEPEQAPPSPDYVPGPEHADDEIIVEDQPYAEDASPIAQSPEYVPESDFEAHPEDDDDEDPKEDPGDYLADGGDDGDDEEESSEDDEDDDMDVEGDEEEEDEEHPAPADFVVVAPIAADQAPSAKETEPFETDEFAATPPPHPAYRMTARISIPAPVPMPAWTDSEKRLDITLGPRYEVGESSSAAASRPAGGLRADYGLVATVDREIGVPVSTDTELGRYVREFETRVRQDTDEIYMRLDDEQTERQLLAGRLNMLFRDRRAHAYTHHLMETEAKMSREAGCERQMRVILFMATDRRRQTVISELLRIDHRRSTDISKLRTALQGQKQMAPRRTTRSTADQETINATSVTNAQLQVMIDQGVTATLAARDALRSTNGDDNHNSGTGVRRTERATRECTYTDFLKCQPLPFKGTEGVASLSQWCERMQFVFHISNCAAENQVKFATCTLHSVALTWWNTHVQTVGHEATYGLPDMIHESVVASKPKTMQEAIKIATELMDKKIRTFAECETASKRKFKNTSRNTQNQQQHPNKRQNIGRVYTAASGEKKQYGGSKPLCAKCNYHHDGPCAPKCRNCNKIGHLARNCRNTANTNNANNQRGTGLGQKAACYECGVQGHFRRECPNMKNNNNHGNQGGRNNALARVYVVGRAGTDPDTNVVKEKYVKKVIPIFLAHITAKEVEDKSEKKRLEDVPIVQNFPKVFLEELPGLPPTRPVEFKIDLVPGAAPCMRTLSSSNLVGESSPNSTTSNTKRHNCRRSKQPFILEESPLDTMAHQRTMAELLRAPTEGYAEAIVVPPILAEHFETKHSLINMMTSDQFFGLEKDNPHDHICWFNKTTSTIKYKDEDLVSKFMNEFFPPSRTTNLRNEISNFQQWFDKLFHEAWDRYKDLLRVCPYHGSSELHQLDTFYNALNPADQDSLNSAAGGNLLERRTQDVLTIIKNKSKVRSSQNKSIFSQVKSSDANPSSSSEIVKLTHVVNQQTSAVITAMTAILKQFQATPPPASVKAVDEIYVTFGGAHPYY
nr:reverse transcriptase domain-containing protein [Tanacetum cinerariifolium]